MRPSIKDGLLLVSTVVGAVAAVLAIPPVALESLKNVSKSPVPAWVVAAMAAAAVVYLYRSGVTTDQPKEIDFAKIPPVLPPNPSPSPAEYGLKFRRPGNGSHVGVNVRVEGIYSKFPDTGRLAIVEYNPTTRSYWIKAEPLTFVRSENRWFTNIVLGGQTDEERTLKLVHLGKDSQILMDYYLTVDEKADRRVQIIEAKGQHPNFDLEYTGLQALPSDAFECDDVVITFDG